MAAISAFRVHKNGVHQTGCLNGAYTPVTFSAAHFNEGGYFDLSTGLYTPPPGSGKMIFGGAVWWGANAKSPSLAPYTSSNFVAKIIKNGGVALRDAACQGWQPAGYTNTAGAVLPAVVDIYEDGDFYELKGFGTSANGINDLVIDGNPAHTYFCGICFAD